MPKLKKRKLFISHAWSYDYHYNQLVSWLNLTSNFDWANYSVPSTDPLSDKTRKGLKTGITNQINPAQGVIILAGMYAAHSEWIKYEIDEAVHLKKVIIGVKPWGQKRVPAVVSDNATVMVNWNSLSIIDTIRAYV
ncbi:TIR domain-containing protein [uncultured Gilliamella sp.]|uniref:TIR domain-containing protein n=1 Tax=uncultured Gilliamella sp. TaxID=1193505 RepID=UPI0025CD9516|nr:TIR domain-containing protein [uncultured Gilliamella sp.]